MALDSIGLFPIRIDLYKKHKTTTVYANEGDIGGRGLTVTLIKDDAPFDSTGIDLKLGFTDVNGVEKLYNFTPINPLVGTYEIIYPVELLQGQGGTVVNVEVKAYEQVTNRLANYNPIYVYVSKQVIAEGTIVGSQEGSTLSLLIAEVERILDEMVNVGLNQDDLALAISGLATAKADLLTLTNTVSQHLADSETKFGNINTSIANIESKIANYNSYASGKDAEGLFTVVDYKRSNNTLYMKSTLSNPNADGKYQTLTWKIYNTAGTTVTKTLVWTLTYDTDGNIVSKVVA